MTKLSNLKTSSRTGLLALALIVGASALSPAMARGNGGGGGAGNGGEPGVMMVVTPPHAIAVAQPAPQRPRPNRVSRLDIKTCTGPMQSVTVGCQVMNSATR